MPLPMEAAAFALTVGVGGLSLLLCVGVWVVRWLRRPRHMSEAELLRRAKALEGTRPRIVA